jgi:hypothetical protein
MKRLDALAACAVGLASLACGAGCNAFFGITPHALADAGPDAPAADTPIPDGVDASDAPAAPDGADAPVDEATIDDGADGTAGEVANDATDADATDGDPGVSAPPCLILDPPTGVTTHKVVSWGLYLAPAMGSNMLIDQLWMPNHQVNPAFGVRVSAIPHGPPYASEAPDAIARQGLVDTGCVETSAVTGPTTLLLAIVVAAQPGASVGASFDVPDGGPVMTGTVAYGGHLYQSGTILRTFNASMPKAAAAYGYPDAAKTAAVYGHSHITLDFPLLTFLPANGPLQTGDFDLDILIADDDGMMAQRAHFTVR